MSSRLEREGSLAEAEVERLENLKAKLLREMDSLWQELEELEGLKQDILMAQTAYDYEDMHAGNLLEMLSKLRGELRGDLRDLRGE